MDGPMFICFFLFSSLFTDFLLKKSFNFPFEEVGYFFDCLFSEVNFYSSNYPVSINIFANFPVSVSSSYVFNPIDSK